ncbi:binding-protein-dependent transport system inner membrane component, partial [mine drainage metagenome]
GVLGHFYTPYPATYDNFQPWLAPSIKHWLGTDYDGHDVFSQFMYGTGVSLYVGAAVALIAVSLGTVVGLISGYYGGLVDNFLMRLVDILLILPTFPLLVILSTYFKPTITSTIIVIGILSWPFMSRVIRSQILTVRQRPFVQAAILAGLPGYKIMFKEIFKFTLPLIIINAVYIFVGAIVAQAGLAFFGLGDLASVNWGTMLYYAQSEDAVIYYAWWWIVPPGVAIAVLGVAANIFGNGITEVFGERAGEI